MTHSPYEDAPAAPVPATPAQSADADTTTPAVAPKTRTALYIGAAAVQFIALLGFGLAGVFGLIPPDQATAGIAVVSGALGTLTAAVASVYRPTRPDVPA